jgi:hypothetical protein
MKTEAISDCEEADSIERLCSQSGSNTRANSQQKQGQTLNYAAYNHRIICGNPQNMRIW